MEKLFKITQKELMEVAGYEPKPFPKYTASFLNLINRWARGTAAKVVGQMSDEVVKCPHRDYESWRKWYLERHPEAIENASKLITKKLNEVKESTDKIDEDLVRMWIEDLVIDKSFWGIKVQEAILQRLGKMTGKKCRLATKEEESKGIDGFIGDIPVQIKPDTYKTASNVKTEKLRARTIYYAKKDGDFTVDTRELEGRL